MPAKKNDNKKSESKKGESKKGERVVGSGEVALARWEPEAWKLGSDERVAVPTHVIEGEAEDVARFVMVYWEGRPGEKGRADVPGLVSVRDEKRGITEKTAEELLSMREGAREAQTALTMLLAPKGAAPMERARFVVGEIAATLSYYFDDGVSDEKDAQLAAIEQRNENTPDSMDAWASALEDYAALGQRYRKAIDGLGGFDAGLLDEAKELAAELRARPAMRAPLSGEVGDAQRLRNRMFTLLWDRMQRVRSAARFVFRGHPAIVREATSAWERQRRTARAGAKKGAGEGSSASTGGTAPS